MNEYRNFDLEEMMDNPHYGKHVSAMTGEKLHSKSDIAAELAWRDAEIQRLQAENDRLRRVNDEHGQNLAKIIDYCKSKGIGKLGQSCIEQLIASHETAEQRVKELERELEGIQSLFANENDDCLIEPFNSENLFKWLNKNDTEQQIKGAVEYTKFCQYCPNDTKMREWSEQLRAANGGE